MSLFSNSKIMNQVLSRLEKGILPWANVSAGRVANSTCVVFVSGSLGTSINTITASYTATYDDQIILVNSTGGVITVTLPTSVGITGRRYTIKDWKGQSATNNITIATTSSQTIDGVTTKVLTTNYQSVTVVSDSANWTII